jgi:hypothetical protein
VAAKRQKAALKQDQLTYELECLRHHLHFVEESQAELDQRLENLTDDVSSDKKNITGLRDAHSRLRADHGRLQEQADKIISLGNSIHKVQAKLRVDEEELADYTEVLLQQISSRESDADITPRSSPEFDLQSPPLSLSPDTTVGSPFIQPLDAALSSDAIDFAQRVSPKSGDYATTPSFYDEDEDVPSPPEKPERPDFGPPSPLVLGPPRLPTPPDPLFSSSNRICVSWGCEPDADGDKVDVGSGCQKLACMVK